MFGSGDEESGQPEARSATQITGDLVRAVQRNRMDTGLPFAFNSGIAWYDEAAPGQNLRRDAACFKVGKHTGEQCGVRITAG
jgi:hypothetical protein